MQLITKIEQLENRTIKSANYIDCSEKVGLIFTDDTYTVIKGHQEYDGGIEVILSGKVDDYLKVEMGVLSEKEYQRNEKREEGKAKSLQKKMELNQLKILKQKYEKEGE